MGYYMAVSSSGISLLDTPSIISLCPAISPPTYLLPPTGGGNTFPSLGSQRPEELVAGRVRVIAREVLPEHEAQLVERQVAVAVVVDGAEPGVDVGLRPADRPLEHGV